MRVIRIAIRNLIGLGVGGVRQRWWREVEVDADLGRDLIRTLPGPHLIPVRPLDQFLGHVLPSPAADDVRSRTLDRPRGPSLAPIHPGLGQEVFPLPPPAAAAAALVEAEVPHAAKQHLVVDHDHDQFRPDLTLPVPARAHFQGVGRPSEGKLLDDQQV